ncbi:hypothetical protein AMK59_8156 [Oryctes borbonicus]|uniref:Uncharacterized protein n=1 Tax=Oryctes borbonicus TaxID=1629725 RepID=A0A0T6AT48_9SCAR|nr:hypothetical protein AMK59_8156 [Oryctes borbonicus]
MCFLFNPNLFYQQTLAPEAFNVWSYNWRLDSWRLRFTNIMGEYTSNYDELSNLRHLVHSYHRFYKFLRLVFFIQSPFSPIANAEDHILVCYRLGPVTNKRTQNIIQWTIQFFGLVLVFRSSQFQEAAMGQIVILVIVYNFPKSWVSKSRTYWKRKFPPKVKLLSNDQYYEQGVRHTSKALDELRSYCMSPNCNQWKTALKLQDVKRFASFVEGNSHLSDDEILEYESSIQNTDLTDDEDDEEILTDED